MASVLSTGRFAPEAVVPVKPVFFPFRSPHYLCVRYTSNSGRVRIPTVPLILPSDLRSRHSGCEKISLFVVKLPLHEANGAAAAHDPTGAQHPADLRRRDGFTLISSVGANSPGPRVLANAGESVSSNIAASIPP